MKNLLKALNCQLILSVLLFSLVTSCATKSETSTDLKTNNEEMAKKSEPLKAPTLKNCICVKMYMPVCGNDKKTYGNACEADCQGVKYTQGACEELK